MMITQWFPDPRFVHIADWAVSNGGSLTRWASAKGIDLTTKAPFEAAMRAFADSLDRLEKLLG